jgi:hypothetical protein
VKAAHGPRLDISLVTVLLIGQIRLESLDSLSNDTQEILAIPK